MEENTSKTPVRYVIAVHGIGEQRKYETVLPIITRFAEARSGHVVGDPLTLGVLASHLATEEWVEFEQIPVKSSGWSQPFVGRHARTGGHNIRFVDLHWGDVMERQIGDFGLPTAAWTQSLINRLESRGAPEWIIELLRIMRAGIVPLQALLSLRLPGLSDKIFNRFLGDVQLYGDYSATRGMAVRRFHDVMAKIHRQHTTDPRFSTSARAAYTVIAHSLGSVMSFDALLLAHGARRKVTVYTGGSRSQHDVLDLEACPIPGYRRTIREGETEREEEDSELPNMAWVEHVESFVTLGSPIDKFLILWWLNYEYLRDTSWMDVRLLAKREPIRHYNYCDEQDPVGHRLDVAYTTEPVKRVFGTEAQEDIVYTRYARPGIAHVNYWQDRSLFRRIVDLVVDHKSTQEAHPVEWFRFWTYVRALCWSYLLIPLAGWAVATTTMVWAVNSQGGWGARLPVAAVSVGTLLVASWLMTLMVQWRHVVVGKRGPSEPAIPEQRWKRAIGNLAVLAAVTAIPIVWAWGLLAILRIMDLPEPRDTAVGSILQATKQFGAWVADFLFVDDVVDRVRGLQDRLVGFGLVPDELAPWKKARVIVAAAIGLSYALLLGLWNAIVFAWMTIKSWRFKKDVHLNFVKYVDNDPSRPQARHA